jgi:hypothetical protein
MVLGGTSASPWGDPFYVIEGVSPYQAYVGWQTNQPAIKLGANNYYNGSAYVRAVTGTCSILSWDSLNTPLNSGWGQFAVYYDATSNSAGVPMSLNLVFLQQGNAVFFSQLTANGTITTTAGNGLLAISSTAKMKIADGFIEDGIGMLMKLIPRYFYWKETEKYGDERQLGFFAQEVNEVSEEASNRPTSKEHGWGIIDRAMIAILVKANQEQNILIDNINSRLDNILNNFSE